MLGFEFRFPANRYHATPWDRQVNEGAVEWPPSSWRVLRALVAVWYRKCPERTSVEQLRHLVNQLSASSPVYEVPDGMRMHTRHYMPLYKYKKGRQKTTKVFDAFIHVEPDARLRMVWPDVDLDDDARALAEVLVERMGYLGRAESWIEGSLLSAEDLTDWEPNARPFRSGETLSDNEELVQLLAPDAPETYETWREGHEEKFRERILAEKRQKGQTPKITGANERKIAEAIPEDFFDALTIETSALKDSGWNRPPGSRWIRYVRPTFDRRRGTARVYEMQEDERPNVARFKIAGSAPPRLTDAVAVGDRMRLAMVSKSDGHPVFTGKTPDGTPLRGHQHTHFIPEALGRHGHVTHLTLWAPMGFDEEALAALSRVERVWNNRAPEFEFDLVFLGSGSREDFAGTNRQAGHSLALVESSTWVSRTPFVPTRHIKKRSDGTPKVDDETGYVLGGARHDLHRLLMEAGFPSPRRISTLEDGPEGTNLAGKLTRWLEFRTDRPSGNGRRATHRGFGFRIEFDQPVRGPLCLGYGAHYGLGRFEPPR